MSSTLRLVCLLILVAPAAASEKPLSDAARKTVVYEMYRYYRGEEFPDIPDISPRKAMALVAAGNVVFVDGRTDAEMNVSMLPGAISREEFLENLDRFRDRTIVAYCTISYRSGKFVRDMAARGFSIYNLEGGILAWTHEGGAIRDDKGITRRIHVYGDKWDYAPAGYETVTFNLFQRIFYALF